MAIIHIEAGNEFNPPVEQLIEHTNADAAAITEFVNHLKLRGADSHVVSTIHNMALRAHAGRLFRGRRVASAEIVIGDRHYEIHAFVGIPNPAPSKFSMRYPPPDMEFRAITFHPDGSCDTNNGVRVRAYNLTTPDWSRN